MTALILLCNSCSLLQGAPDCRNGVFTSSEHSETTYSYRLVDPTPLPAHESIEAPVGLQNVAVNGRSGLMYVHRRQWTGRQMGQPTGIYRHDIATGRVIDGAPIASEANPGQLMIVSDGDSVFDFVRGCAYVERTDSVLRIDLGERRSQIIAGSDLHDSPWIGADHLLLKCTERDRIIVLGLASHASETLAIPRGARSQHISIHGGIDEHTFVGTVSHIGKGQCDHIVLLRREKRELKVVKSLPLGPGVRTRRSAIDWKHGLWISVQSANGQSRAVIYDVPSLSSKAQLPGEWFQRVYSMTCVAEAGLLLVTTADRKLIAYDLIGLKVSAQVDLGAPDPNTLWRPVADPAGVYIGAFDPYWGVTLFSMEAMGSSEPGRG